MSRWFIVFFVASCGSNPPPPANHTTSSRRTETAAAPPKNCVWIEVFEILERVYFDPGSSGLRGASTPIVDAIAETIKANPRIDKLGVVGARSAGEADALALDRANAMVAALIARGVPARQLEAHGHLGLVDGDQKVVWFVMLRVDNEDRRPSAGDARWVPLHRDCSGTPLDCDCIKAPP